MIAVRGYDFKDDDLAISDGELYAWLVLGAALLVCAISLAVWIVRHLIVVVRWR